LGILELRKVLARVLNPQTRANPARRVKARLPPMPAESWTREDRVIMVIIVPPAIVALSIRLRVGCVPNIGLVSTCFFSQH